MMHYDLTEERNAYLQARGYVVLSACPGSGKTTSVVRKLKDISDYCEGNYGRHTGFACLSFTNKACDEIMERYHDMNSEWIHFPNLVSTIDSFIMQTVVLPFWYLYQGCTQRPVVVNDVELLKQLFYTKYYDENGHEHKAIVSSLRDYHDLVYGSLHPENVSLQTYLEYKNSADAEDQRKYQYCKAVMAYRISKGTITSDDALFMACVILFQHPEIAHVISNRFPYIIVDEAQDNSKHQHVFFELLKRNGLMNLEMVGDPCQSIYRFRSARPEIFAGYMSKDEWQTLHFSECRRSNQRIIDFYNRLKPANIPDVKSYGVADIGIPITIYKYDDGNRSMITNDFKQTCNNYGLKDTAIIARGNSMCRKIAGVQETNLRYWKSQLPYYIIEAMLEVSDGNYSKAFSNIRKMLCRVIYGESQYEHKRKFLSEIEHDLNWNRRILKFLSSIPSLSLSFADWTNQCSELIRQYWKLDHDVDFEPHQRILGHSMAELRNKPVEQYYSSTDKGSSYRNIATTIHSLKGASLDAVLLFLSKNSSGQNISINDFPDSSIAMFDNMTEKHNMLYVACSRAKQFLALAVPSTVDDALINRKFHGLDIRVKRLGLQQEIPLF